MVRRNWAKKKIYADINRAIKKIRAALRRNEEEGSEYESGGGEEFVIENVSMCL